MFLCVPCSYGVSECIRDIQMSFSMMCFSANIWRGGQCLRQKETMRAVKSMNYLFNLTWRMTTSCYCIESKTKTETQRNATEFPWELLWNTWWQHSLKYKICRIDLKNKNQTKKPQTQIVFSSQELYFFCYHLKTKSVLHSR